MTTTSKESWDRQVRKQRVEEMVHALLPALATIRNDGAILKRAENLIDSIDAAYPDAKPEPTPPPIGTLTAVMDAEPPPPNLKPGYGDYR